MPARGTPKSLISLYSRGQEASSICRACAHTLRRQYASAATAAVETPVKEVPATKNAYQLHASIVLSRPPQITRDLDPFEKSFFLYQKRLNERLALPFTRYFYFRKGTPALIDFQKKVKVRKTAARDIGDYSAYEKTSWHDESLMGAQEGERDHQMKLLLQDEPPWQDENEPDKTKAAEEKVIYERPQPRITEADKAGDEKSLDRLLQRSLYLLVQNAEGKWMFPTVRLNVAKRESLKEGAQRALLEAAGEDMNMWTLGNQPVGHFERPYDGEMVKMNDQGNMEHGELHLFIKARIMAGQVNITENAVGVKDFKWLVREEMQKLVHQKYWSSVEKFIPRR